MSCIPNLRLELDWAISSFVPAGPVLLNPTVLRYRRLVQFVTQRVLKDTNKAKIAAENCMLSASSRVEAFGSEGALRSWLMRLALDEALTMLREKNRE